MTGVRLVRIAPVAAAALLLPCCRQGDPSGAGPANRRPNIIFLTVDTLRADHIGLYGYARNTMPSVEAFAKTAVVFDNAVVPRGTTRPSYASMLTGLYPFHHGVRSVGAVLHEDIITLQETLKSAGYHTAGFVSNFVLIGELSGFSQGFDVYDDHLEELRASRNERYIYQRTAHNMLAAILEWLNADPPEPFFLFTNFIDPHGPYDPPERFRKVYRSDKTRILRRDKIPDYVFVEGQFNYHDYVDRYDGEVRYADEAIGILIDELKRKGVWDDALVVFTADHGESLGEHNMYFQHYLHVWEATMHVPLAIRVPSWSGERRGIRPRRVRSVCSPMDLAPTVLDYLNLRSSVDFDGQSLLPLLEGGQDNDRALFLEFPSVADPKRPFPDYYAIRTATHKLIRIYNQNNGRLLEQTVTDVAADRMERDRIPFDPHSPLHRSLSDKLESMVARVRQYELPFTLTEYFMPFEQRPAFIDKRRQDGKTIVKTLTDDQAERLRGLGYVH